MWPIAEVVPHAGDMILLDAIEHVDAEHIVCVREVRANEMFSTTDGSLPVWAGIELMAQSIAAWAGCQARLEQRDVRLGFLLGTRHYVCNVDTFPLGSVLRVQATCAFSDHNGMGVFICRIDAPGIHAEARLTVFSPPNAAAYLTHTDADTSHV